MMRTTSRARTTPPLGWRRVPVPRFSATALLALGVASAGWMAAAPSQAQQPKCPPEPQRRALDFWVGSWQVENSRGERVASSEVTHGAGGCSLEESFVTEGVTGSGVTYFDPSDGSWRVLWVDSLGRIARYRGAVEGDRATFSGQHIAADGSIEQSRRSIERTDQDRLAYRVELSKDEGDTWTVAIDGAYVRGKASEQRVRTTENLSTPSPGTREAGSVESRSPEARATESRITAPRVTGPRAEAPTRSETPSSGAATALSPEAALDTLEVGVAQVHMSSPMTVRLPLGPIERLRRGYAWSSTDTSPFTCQGASVRRIRVSKDARGKKVKVGFELALHSTAFAQKVRLDAVLVDPENGSSIGTTTQDKVPIGRGTTSQVNDGHVTRDLVIELDADVFDRAFSEQSRPVLELTLTQLEAP